MYKMYIHDYNLNIFHRFILECNGKLKIIILLYLIVDEIKHKNIFFFKIND
jgi:hypothetical protein